MAPSSRFMWLGAAVVLPAAAVAGFVPALAIPGAAVLLAVAVIAAFDAVRGTALVEKIGARTPEILRLTKDVAGTLAVTISNRAESAVPVRIAIVLPAGVTGEKLVEEIEAPAGEAELAWPCTGI